MSEIIADLFTAMHGYMPKYFRDSVLVPIPKSGKNLSISDNYRPISLASSLSKILEHIILDKFSHYLHSNQLDHGKLFSKLQHRGLPTPILRFLVNWYSLQEMRVRWGDCFSEPFGVSNGVRQGGVLSPVLFAVYLDGLLEELSDSGVGCYWGHMFAGTLSYADDIVILAPCASALRRMLDICSLYAHDHGLLFNASKTQLICFCSCKNCRFLPLITFNNTALPYKNEVIHLGHVLSFDLNDGPDVTRALRSEPKS